MNLTSLLRKSRSRLLSPAAIPWWLLALGLLLRLEYLREFAASPLFTLPIGPDVAEYDARAREILGGRWLPRSVEIHAPLYAWLLALCYRLGNYAVPLARAVGLLLTLAAMWGLSRLVARLAGFRTGCWFLAAAAVWPPLLFHGAELVSEGLLLTLLAAALILLARRRWGGAGLTAGLAAITHPAALAVIAGWALIAGRPWRRRYRRGLVFLGSALIPVAVVSGWNTCLAGRPVLIQANGAFNLYLGNNPAATGGCYLRPGRAWNDEHRLARQEAEARGISVDALYLERIARFWRDEPGRAAGLLLRKALLIWHPRELPAGADAPELVAATPLLRTMGVLAGAGLALALGGLGWLLAKRRRIWRYRYFLVWFLAGSAVQILAVSSGRYRVLLLGPIFLFLALALTRLPRWWAPVLAAVGAAFYGLLPAPELPGEADAQLGEAYYQLGAAAAAQQHLECAARVIDDPARFHNLLGELARKRGELAAAERHFRLAAEGAPEEPSGVLNLALLATEREDWAGATAAYAEMFRRDPDYALGRYNYGWFLAGRGDVAGAEREFRRCTELAPGDYRAFNSLGVLAAERGELAAAAAYFRQALRRNPGDRRLQHNLEWVETQLQSRP